MKLFVRHGSDQMHALAEPLPGNLRRKLTTAAALADNRQLKVILAQSFSDTGSARMRRSNPCWAWDSPPKE